MKCPYCSSFQNVCVDSRIDKSETFRRRGYRCKDCGKKILTYEFIAKDYKEAKEAFERFGGS